MVFWAYAGLFPCQARGEEPSGFTSNLPLVVVDLLTNEVSRQRRIPVSVAIIDTRNGRSSLQGPAAYSGPAALWSRGSSSRMRPKRPYRLEVQTANGEDLKVPLLGLPKESDWILYPSFLDKTFIRDVLAYDLWRAMGHYAPRWRYVEVFIKKASTNGTNHPQGQPSRAPRKADETSALLSQITMADYEGVYVLLEKIKRGKDRLALRKLDREGTDEPEITGGYIFKKDRVNSGEHGFKSAHGLEFAYEEPKERDLTPAQERWLTNYVNAFEQALFSEDFCNPDTGYAQYLDVDSFIDYHWIVEATKNIDGYWFSQFYYKDRGGKLHAGPIWDWDLSFGNAYYLEGHRTNGWRWTTMHEPHYQWYRRLFEDPDFLQRYIDRWHELRQDVLATAHVLARVDAMAMQLQEAQARNYSRWATLGTPVHPKAYAGKTYQAEVGHLKKWIEDRLAWIDSQDFPPPMAKVLSIAQGKDGGLKAALSCEAGRIFYTIDGTDPRARGGGVSSQAREYRAPVPIGTTMPVIARTRSEYDLWSAPLTIKRVAFGQ